MSPESFAGNQKVGQSILWPLEQRFIRWMAPRIPSWIHSSQLTLAAIPLSMGIVGCGFLAQTDERWLWVGAFLIFAHWFTDSLDGAVGRLRGDGLFRWGFYMDHFLDYVFLVAVLTSYMLLLPPEFMPIYFPILAIFSAFMIHSFLGFGATNQFQIAYMGIGPTEIRVIFIVINILLSLFGKTYLRWSLPFVLGFSVLGLIILVYRTQKTLHQFDLEK